MLKMFGKNKVLPPMKSQCRTTIEQVHLWRRRSIAGFQKLSSSGLTRMELVFCVLFWVLIPGATACLSFYFTWRLGLKGGLGREALLRQYSAVTVPK